MRRMLLIEKEKSSIQ